jgi:hypothetical protein
VTLLAAALPLVARLIGLVTGPAEPKIVHGHDTAALWSGHYPRGFSLATRYRCQPWPSDFTDGFARII